MAHIAAAQPMGEGFFAHLFNPTGRTNRAKWWLAALIYTILYAAALGVLYWLYTQGMPLPGLAIFGVVALVIMVSSILIAIRRLHDRDKSGHWLWLFFVLPGVLSGSANVVMAWGTSEAVIGGMVLALVSLGISIWALVELGCLRGTRGANRFGPDPLQA
jgi:uncharacterized membrane protein YhaH (DUF805 family)